jgi:3-oxoacyl-[acyl-carrier-protein] synthase II
MEGARLGMSQAVVTAYELITPYGGLEASWSGLRSGISVLSRVDRFETAAFQSQRAGTVPGLNYRQGPSLVFQLLEKLFTTTEINIPSDARLLLATTTGEVDLLEQAVLSDSGSAQESGLERLLEKTRVLYGVQDSGTVISSACTSSTAAIALGASAIREGECDCVLVVACDAVTEFVFAGFSSLMALDPDGARPFDANRKGLSVGEGAGYLLLMSEERARKEKRPILGTVAGWGLSNDANHMTGPSRDGAGLAKAIRTALRLAETDENQIGFICAHGTGTSYNDTMELLAFQSVFSSPRPLFSVKGGMGHTMGAAGLIETVLTLKCIQEQCVLPTIRLQQPDELAAGRVSAEAVPTTARIALSTNAGFGGVNAALVLAVAEGES